MARNPSVYNIKKDELYELDDESFEFLKLCSSENGCDSEDTEFIDYCMAEEAIDYEDYICKTASPHQSLLCLHSAISNSR